MHFQPKKPYLAKFMRGRGKRFLRVLALLAVVAIGLLGFWFILRVTLNTEYPILPVSSENMCTVKPHCDGFNHPFERTLHIGDLIIVRGVDARSVEVAYPNSDVLVFHTPKQNSYQEDALTITRVMAKEERDGIIYFRTKGDGEEIHEYDQWYDYRENYTWNGMISENLLVGKVVLRIPWVGHFALFIHNSSWIFVIVIIIIMILIVEFIIPAFVRKKAETEPKKSAEKTFEARLYKGYLNTSLNKK